MNLFVNEHNLPDLLSGCDKDITPRVTHGIRNILIPWCYSDLKYQWINSTFNNQHIIHSMTRDASKYPFISLYMFTPTLRLMWASICWGEKRRAKMNPWPGEFRGRTSKMSKKENSPLNICRKNQIEWFLLVTYVSIHFYEKVSSSWGTQYPWPWEARWLQVYLYILPVSPAPPISLDCVYNYHIYSIYIFSLVLGPVHDTRIMYHGPVWPGVVCSIRCGAMF